MFEDQELFAPLTETEREVCEAAINHFYEGDFQTSAEILANIVANRPNDHRFKHNLAVAEFRQRSGTGWGTFVQELNKTFTDAKLTQEPDNITPENVRYPVLWYNLAVLLFHQKRYNKTLQILENLSKTFSSVPTQLTNRTKLLLIDVLIKLQQYERALIEIELYETQQCRPGSADITATSTPAKSSQGTVQTGVDAKFETDSKIKLQQYKTLCHLCMKSLKVGKKECKLLFNLTGPAYRTLYVGTCLKAYHEYLRGNFKKSHKIISNAKLSIAEGNAVEETLINHGDLLNVAWLNNEACCDFYMGRPTSAGILFQKASQEFDKYYKRDQVKLPLHAIKHTMKPDLLYNFGVTLLNLKRPKEAFTYLNICLSHYYNNPRLWLRVAECCIHIYKSDNTQHLNLSTERRNLIKEIRGNDASKKLVFAESSKSSSKPKPPSTTNTASGKSSDTEQPTMEYAGVCLENALRLVESDSIANEGCLYVRPSTPIFNIQEINCLHAAILCAAAYVQLILENYPLCIKRCHQLKSLQNIPGAYQYLARQYMGEAYYKYGQLAKAQEAFFQENACDVNFFINPDVEDKKEDVGTECSWPGQSVGGATGTVKPINDWYPNDEFTARAILIYNQAVTLASSGELDKASEILKMWISKNEGPLAPEFLKLAVYLHIRLGNIAKAKSLLKNSSKI